MVQRHDRIDRVQPPLFGFGDPELFDRRRQRLDLLVSVGELEESEATVEVIQKDGSIVGKEAESLGMRLSSLTPELRQNFGISDKVNGVVVTDIDPASAAAGQGIRPGDVILEVGLEEVSEPAEVIERVSEADRDKRKVVLLLVDREGDLVAMNRNGEVAVVEPTGAETHLVIRSGKSEVTSVLRERGNYRVGDTITLAADPAAIHLFDKSTGARLA